MIRYILLYTLVLSQCGAMEHSLRAPENIHPFGKAPWACFEPIFLSAAVIANYVAAVTDTNVKCWHVQRDESKSIHKI